MKRLRITVAAIIAASLAFTAIGCAPEAPSSDGDSDDPVRQEAYDAALEIVGGEPIGGTVTILGVLGGDETDAFLESYRPFEEATGIEIQYEGTRDIAAILQTRIDGGNPPELVMNPGVGQMIGFIESGDLTPLDDLIDSATAVEDFDAGLLELGSNDDGTLYGLMTTASVKGLMHYNPAIYEGPTDAADFGELLDWAEERAADGHSPWCIGIESGPASGWPATDWIEQFLLTGSGTEVWDRWWQGDLPWTSPEVREAFEAFGEIATSDVLVNGGPTAVTGTDFLQAVLPMYAEPPRCDLTLQADWLSGAIAGQVEGVTPGEDIDFFAFPPVDPANGGLVEISGDMLGAFADTPQVRAFLQYTLTPERGTLLARQGLWLSTNRQVAADAYPTPPTQAASAILSSATGLRFDGSDIMPAELASAFLAATVAYVSNPASLDEQLEKLEVIRLEQ